jgi:hypothetical protein
MATRVARATKGIGAKSRSSGKSSIAASSSTSLPGHRTTGTRRRLLTRSVARRSPGPVTSAVGFSRRTRREKARGTVRGVAVVSPVERISVASTTAQASFRLLARTAITRGSRLGWCLVGIWISKLTGQAAENGGEVRAPRATEIAAGDIEGGDHGFAHDLRRHGRDDPAKEGEARRIAESIGECRGLDFERHPLGFPRPRLPDP